jgi:hypothetical protein
MAFKLKKTSDNLFHKVSVSQSKQAPTNPMLNVGTSGKNNPSATPLKDIDSKGRDRPLTAAQQAADDKEASITPPFDKKKKDPYAEAAKKDSKLGSYVKARKHLNQLVLTQCKLLLLTLRKKRWLLKKRQRWLLKKRHQKKLVN